jgi:hypothetical protein
MLLKFTCWDADNRIQIKINQKENLMNMTLPEKIRAMRIPYAMRRLPPASFSTLLPCQGCPVSGDIALARLEKIGKNARLELANGRPATLHEGDIIGVVFGNRYASEQFEGYARREGDFCDLLSMGGLCGLVESKHSNVADPSKLKLLGALGDKDGRPLRLRDFALSPVPLRGQPKVIVVCGSSMDAGKTHTAMSLVFGLRQRGERVAGIKLTGTAAGRDTWNLLDAGASPALDFVDGGFPSTYLCNLQELLSLYRLLLAHAASHGASTIVVEIADGLFQRETSSLLQSPTFAKTVHHWLFATSDPLAGEGGVRVLRSWGIQPTGISGVISMSPLAMREVQAATGIQCLTAKELQRGALNDYFKGAGAMKVNGNPTNLLPESAAMNVGAAL